MGVTAKSVRGKNERRPLGGAGSPGFSSQLTLPVVPSKLATVQVSILYFNFTRIDTASSLIKSHVQQWTSTSYSMHSYGWHSCNVLDSNELPVNATLVLCRERPLRWHIYAF